MDEVEVCQQLLRQLKSVVEGLLASQLTNVWQVYGGLNRLHNVIFQIFNHGCKSFNDQGEQDCWGFIQGLSWLQPALATSPTFVSGTDPDARDRAKTWIYKSLEGHTLAQKLSWLLSDKEHLNSCFHDFAFLCRLQYSEAALICLRAVEENQLSLLTDIDPTLFLSKWKAHRRCVSLPDAMPRRPRLLPPPLPPPTPAPRPRRPRTWHSLPSLLDPTQQHNKLREPVSAPMSRRPCTLPSSPALRARSPTYTSTPICARTLSPTLLQVDYKKPQPTKGILKTGKYSRNISKELIVLKDVSSKSEPIEIKHIESKNVDLNLSIASSNGSSDILDFRRKLTSSIHEISNSIFEETDSSLVDLSSLESFKTRVKLKSGGVRCGVKSGRKKSFMESGGQSIQPMSTGFFPRPKEGQSLASFLSSAQFAGARAELDRENAHFAISEAMISAVEQVKYNMWMKAVDDTIEESDEEINQLKQRIRLRRRQKQVERHSAMLGISLLSDGRTDTTTTESVSPISTSPGGSSDSISTDGVDDLEIDDNTSSNLNRLADSGLSVSLASLFSEAELSRPRLSSPPGELLSAEGVALALLRRFSDKQLPRASDIQWLVSEKDACGQSLLPLPTSWPVSPDEAEDQDMRGATALRGTMQWAPPRPQIIFSAHPPPNRRVLMAKQSYRCAGCGMAVAPQYASKFRYCEYLGRYFCTGCHTNQLATVPGRVIHKWDFTRCAVSIFSYRLLDQMSSDPLFNISDLNPGLYSRTRVLDRVRVYRMQLHYLKDFLNTCRFAKEGNPEFQEFLQTTPDYFLSEPQVFSLQDLVAVKSGQLGDRLRQLVENALHHVDNCLLCQGRGFVCEVCKSPDVIFPWQLNKVHRCNSCGNCFHTACHTPSTQCGRCTRITARRNSSAESHEM